MATRSDALDGSRSAPRANGTGLAQRVQCWHRRAGLLAGVVLALLALSGIALNHTDALGLAARKVTAPWVLAHYGRAPALPHSGFVAAGHVVVAAGGTAFLDGRALPVATGRLAGALALPSGELVVALPDELLLVDAHGTVVERIGDADGLPGPVRRIGAGVDGVPVVATGAGDHALDLGRLRWSRYADRVRWSRPEPLTAAARDALRVGLAGEAVSLERVLLDLHSGRWFGAAGVLVVDLAGLVCLLLAASGAWTWWRASRQGRAG